MMRFRSGLSRDNDVLKQWIAGVKFGNSCFLSRPRPMGEVGQKRRDASQREQGGSVSSSRVMT
jgi:hypothetical protein